LQKIVRGDGATGPKGAAIGHSEKSLPEMQGRMVCCIVCGVKDFSHGAGE